MTDVPLLILFIVLVVLIAISAFFSSSETGMMALNRYRLKTLAAQGKKRAQRVEDLLNNTDKLIGMILLGNNFVNILASSIATMIGLRLYGNTGAMIATGILTLVVLVFAEITPKTIAAIHPEKIAYPAARPLKILIVMMAPLVYLLNRISQWILRLLGISTAGGQDMTLSHEEIRTIVSDSGAKVKQDHRQMLLGIFDLESKTVEDIMIPRHEIFGVNIEDDADKIRTALINSQHTRVPLYKHDINNIIGLVHLKYVMPLLTQEAFDKAELANFIREPFFIPENSALGYQLPIFQKHRRRVGLVIDEYGDLKGLVTLEDMLEEVIGRFTTDVSEPSEEIHPQPDGSFLVDATIQVRELNDELSLDLPTSPAKTLNGLLLEQLENIPTPGTSLKINNLPIEIVATRKNSVATVRMMPNRG
jgi:Mg2+/Co2+ transporter CorB